MEGEAQIEGKYPQREDGTLFVGTRTSCSFNAEIVRLVWMMGGNLHCRLPHEWGQYTYNSTQATS